MADDTLLGACPVPTDPDVWRRKLAALHAAGAKLPDRDAPPALSTTRPAPEPFTAVVRPAYDPYDGKFTSSAARSRAAAGKATRRRVAAARAQDGGEAA